MENNRKNDIALFRFGLISNVLNSNSSLSIKQQFKILSERFFTDPDGKLVKVSPGTIERWYYKYLKFGFDSLKPNSRNDCGHIRKADDEVIKRIEWYVNNHPRMKATTIYQTLIDDSIITNKDLSLSTVTRYVSRIKKNNGVLEKPELKRYEAEHVNDVWCCDTTYSFKITINGEKKRMYIIAIIDDASRLIVGVDVFLADNYNNFLQVLTQAVSKYGKPKFLNLDNGSPYKNKQIEMLSARTGIILRYCAPFSGWQKGKIERWFRTMKDHFMACYNINSQTKLEDFRRDLLEYVIKYNNSSHSSLPNNISPATRFFEFGDEILYLNEEIINRDFLLELERKVSIDCVVNINNIEYEVPTKYANSKITLRYTPKLDKLYIVNDDELVEIGLLDKISNSKIKRKQPIFNTKEGQ